MRTVHKHTLKPGITKLMLPTDAKFLAVHEQHGEVRVWVEVDTGKVCRERQVLVIGTGHDIPDNYDIKHIGTVFFDNLVFHAFELRGRWMIIDELEPFPKELE